MFDYGRMGSRLSGSSPATSASVDSRFRGNDDSNVIPAKAGIHAALTEDERAVAGTGGEIPCVTAEAGPLTVDGFRGNDGENPENVIPAKAGIHRLQAERWRMSSLADHGWDGLHRPSDEGDTKRCERH